MDKLDRQVDYWNRAAAEKTFTHPLDVARLRELVPEDAAILDYGCGYGRICAELVSLGYRRVTGVDISQSMVARGHARFPDLDLQVHPHFPLPFAADTFDVCILFAVLTCIPGDDGQRELLAELGRILRPNGLLYISDYPIQADERNQSRYRQFEQEHGTFGTFRLPDGGVVRHHEMSWIHELLAAFTLVNECELDVPTMNGNPARIFQIIARKKDEG